eukprot:CAMPEP_0117516700 /NCGR_PEP_ID=MMETSP0784-20121206/31229_1 /TAXON_ID=39447 /ORGANISM="" /LENGTH=171 /DNA_ID=CAMNT_0005312553 /DNA_START=89 /DNA_END=600 /DNA_ORIENTATION=-
MLTVLAIGLAALFPPAGAVRRQPDVIDGASFSFGVLDASASEQTGLHVPSKLGLVQVPSRDVAFTGIFSFGIDPQRGKTYQADDFGHIRPWYDSCQNLGMTCIHTAGATFREFVIALEKTRQNLEKRPGDDHYLPHYVDQSLEKLTTADMRFIEFLDYLRSPEGSDVEYAL